MNGESNHKQPTFWTARGLHFAISGDIWSLEDRKCSQCVPISRSKQLLRPAIDRSRNEQKQGAWSSNFMQFPPGPMIFAQQNLFFSSKVNTCRHLTNSVLNDQNDNQNAGQNLWPFLESEAGLVGSKRSMVWISSAEFLCRIRLKSIEILNPMPAQRISHDKSLHFSFDLCLTM